MPSLTPGLQVTHPIYGNGTVQDHRDSYGWVLVTFENGQNLWVKPEDEK